MEVSGPGGGGAGRRRYLKLQSQAAHGRPTKGSGALPSHWARFLPPCPPAPADAAAAKEARARHDHAGTRPPPFEALAVFIRTFSPTVFTHSFRPTISIHCPIEELLLCPDLFNKGVRVITRRRHRTTFCFVRSYLRRFFANIVIGNFVPHLLLH